MINLYRERALFKFKRYLFHELRNQVASGQEPNLDTASTKALWTTRTEILELMQEDNEFKGSLDREEAWADVLINIMWLRQMLFDLPTVGVDIDLPKVKRTIDSVQSATGVISENFVAGTEHKIELEEEKKHEEEKDNA